MTTIDYKVTGVNLDQDINIKGMAPITGGGLLENVPRILPANCDVETKMGTWPTHNLNAAEIFRTFNMGVGMVIIAESNSVELMRAALQSFPGYPLYEIGQVVARKQKVKLI